LVYSNTFVSFYIFNYHLILLILSKSKGGEKYKKKE
jgi:hypothetical protein